MSTYGEMAYFEGNACAHVEAYERHMLQMRRKKMALVYAEEARRCARRSFGSPAHVMNDTLASFLRSCA